MNASDFMSEIRGSSFSTLTLSATSQRLMTWDDLPWSYRMNEAREWLESVRRKRLNEAETIARAENWEWAAPPEYAA